jgi:hypothetical protein
MIGLLVCEGVPAWAAVAGVVAVVLVADAASVEADSEADAALVVDVVLAEAGVALVAAGAKGIRPQANKYWKAISRK